MSVNELLEDFLNFIVDCRGKESLIKEIDKLEDGEFVYDDWIYIKKDGINLHINYTDYYLDDWPEKKREPLKMPLSDIYSLIRNRKELDCWCDDLECSERNIQ